MKTEILKNDFLRRRLLSESGGGWPFAENLKTRLEESTRTSTKSTVQSVDVSRACSRAGKIAAGVIATLTLMAAMLGGPGTLSARTTIGVTVSFGPPALPYYVQPPCPAPCYVWTPGYWAWDPALGYFSVPGTWVRSPFIGALWTPGYWDYDDGVYVWYAGYWGPAVGYYGGIDYGYGYTGEGYQGGYWNHGTFYYNRTVNTITTLNITNVYGQSVDEHFRDRHISYHGGPGGTRGGPTPAQFSAARQRRSTAVSAQQHQILLAKANPVERASVNHGRPGIAATWRPGAFNGHDAVPAKRAGGPYHEPPHNNATNGGRTERPAHKGSASPHPKAAPNPQPARGGPERPRMHERPQPKRNPPNALPERRVPNRTQPPEGNRPESHARRVPPPKGYAKQEPPSREHHSPPKHAEHKAAPSHNAHHPPPARPAKHGPPEKKNGDGHGHGG
jgi:WXXGXW repeat (2 copies)